MISHRNLLVCGLMFIICPWACTAAQNDVADDGSAGVMAVDEDGKLSVTIQSLYCIYGGMHGSYSN